MYILMESSEHSIVHQAQPIDDPTTIDVNYPIEWRQYWNQSGNVIQEGWPSGRVLTIAKCSENGHQESAWDSH